MFGLFNRNNQSTGNRYGPPPGPPPPPPQWAPAPEVSHQWGLWADASETEYEDAEKFCEQYPVDPPKLLPSDIVDRIDAEGCKAWGIDRPSDRRFRGKIKDMRKDGSGVINVETDSNCLSVCLMSDLPIMAGLYDIQGKNGVYYEIEIHKMEGIIAIGTSCHPYPMWRMPGWNRLSAGFHLDDFRKFFEDPDGGRDYSPLINHISRNDIIGCGYEFATGAIFYTYNGMRLPNAFTGVYLPRHIHDVYAAWGVEGGVSFDVNFGGELFKWKEGNEWAWRVEGHVGRLTGSSGAYDDELPSYNQVRFG